MTRKPHPYCIEHDQPLEWCGHSEGLLPKLPPRERLRELLEQKMAEDPEFAAFVQKLEDLRPEAEKARKEGRK